MSEAALLRPGIAAGSYPEREDVRESWLDRTTSAVFGALTNVSAPIISTAASCVRLPGLQKDSNCSRRINSLKRRLFCVAICTAMVCAPIW